MPEHEHEMLAETRRRHPDIAGELEELWIRERRKATLCQFMPRRGLPIMISRLEELT